MKKLAAFMLMLFCFSAYADVTITEKSTEADMVTYFSKNITAHYINGQLTNITDMKKGVIYVFNPMNKTYFQATFAELKQFADKAAEQMNSMAENPQYKQYMNQMQGSGITVVKTGTQVIAGFSCDEYKVASPMTVSVVCLSKDLMTLVKKEVDTSKAEKIMNSLDMESAGNILGKKLAELEDKYGYIVSEKFSSPIPGMAAEDETRVISVSKKMINPMIFNIPAGYKQVKMQDAVGEY